MTPLRWYHIGQCFIEVWPDACTTYFPDGRRVVAGRMFPEGMTFETPDAFGYLDPWEMNVDHELAHTWLAAAHGLPWSRTLWAVAHPEEGFSEAVADVEEDIVLTFQRGLDKQDPRPWDLFSMSWT